MAKVAPQIQWVSQMQKNVIDVIEHLLSKAKS